ncbi:MAG: GTPase ObgE [Ignavibacteriales bacterium]|nr:GTPase ObgE [Ignavibacteriales bacterium]
MFIDYVEIKVSSGKGGDGAIQFRREKYVPKGGPSGGNGGDGGNVWLIANENLNTLLDNKYQHMYLAQAGAAGGASLRDGKKGEDLEIFVPVGTLIKNLDTGEIMYDFTAHGEKYCIAKGGRGGKGNSNFATPSQQVPRWAEDGKPGQEFNIALELKLIADIGLVGFPNAGKSTLISVVSAAKPKIADYPFTTLEPNLGIVRYKEYRSFTVADIPGIIEGASEGKGLGLQFLRHIERTKALCFLIDASSETYQDDIDVLMNELDTFSKEFIGKKKILAFSKSDIIDEEKRDELLAYRDERFTAAPMLFSAVTSDKVRELLDEMWRLIHMKVDD